jgi:hypothetical protein
MNSRLRQSNWENGILIYEEQNTEEGQGWKGKLGKEGK